jgi:hypothetical protein
MSLVGFVCACGGLGLGAAAAQAMPFISNLQPNPSPIATTVPLNGDVNPYGIVTVPNSVGALRRGELLVSNFNNSNNAQGTGTTIVQIPPGGNNTQGTASQFAQISDPACPGGVGLTTALAVTRTGYVIVGSLPTSNGMAATAQAGCLIVLNSYGQVVETIAGGPINGPWDMAAAENGIFTTLYVTNVLNGTVAAGVNPVTGLGNVVDHGTVVRIELLTLPGVRPIVLNEHVIATGFAERTDPNALVVGPTGDAIAPDGTLYVADTQNSRIAAIPDAPFREFPTRHGGFTVSSGGDLNGPLGMTLAPDGDILTANGGDGNIVETTPGGKQTDISADATGGGGALFGLTVSPGADGVFFVDDANNTLRELVR